MWDQLLPSVCLRNHRQATPVKELGHISEVQEGLQHNRPLVIHTSIRENMGRKRKTIDIDQYEDTFRDLDLDYRENERNDVMVAALNSLPPDERSLMILYIANGNNKTEVGRILGASEAFVRYKIKEIQEKLKDKINKTIDQ